MKDEFKVMSMATERVPFLVSDGRMLPALQIGDIVGGELLPIADFKQLEGEITAAVKLQSGNTVICRISPLTSTEINLLCAFTDPSTAPQLVAFDAVKEIYKLDRIMYRGLE